MKALLIITLLFISINGATVFAQEETSSEKYGNTLNAGLGIGYYGYIGHSMPVINVNYEISIAKNFTLAPFITVYSYRSYRYWGNPNYEYRNYSYRQTVIPIGVKGTYYFDQLLHAGSKWDFYLAGSLGFAIRKTTWENDYYGETFVENSSSGLYMDIHLGAEYHFNQRLGMYLDLSTGLSSLGLAFHL